MWWIREQEDTAALEIEEGKDYCTLVTCTPYGINTHRLLVRGHRIENLDESIRVTADAIQIDPLIFRNQLWFKLPIAISWHINLEFTVLAF